MRSLPRPFFAACLISVLQVTPLAGDVQPHPLFSDHAVLQQGIDLPVWGAADSGEKVTVAIAGQSISTIARDGRWIVRLRPLAAGGPFTLTIEGNNRLDIADVLVGEVWLNTGHSRMQRQSRAGEDEQPDEPWMAEIASADLPQIRHFVVTPARALTPQSAVSGVWSVCSPETAGGFSAVSYTFARDLHRARKSPVGLIECSWGGTPVEAWTSATGLRDMPEFRDALQEIALYNADPPAAAASFASRLGAWFRAYDPGSNETLGFARTAANIDSWPTINLPADWEENGLPGFDGVVWFRTEFAAPDDWEHEPLSLHLGAIDDFDSTWINGRLVGTTSGHLITRVYSIPGDVVRPGRNVIAIRVLDIGDLGGLWGGEDSMRIGRADGAGVALALHGSWWRKASVSLANVPRPPEDFSRSPKVPTVLYNGMVAPLQPFAIRGVIWTHNTADRQSAAPYRTRLPALIADWRDRWAQGEFPFLFVQAPAGRGIAPETREAQLLTARRVPNTAMVASLDCVPPGDNRASLRQPIGTRLALAARAVAYDELIEFSGPVLESLTIDGSRALLRFSHTSGRLVVRDGPLRGFTICGADKVFHPARATVSGDTIMVRSEDVLEPIAVRYAWAEIPDGNLFNLFGLPASPFRTDLDE